MAALAWFRFDLRLADNPALETAAGRGRPVIPVFIWAPEEEGDWGPGAASRWWLHQSLAALRVGLRQRGSDLVLRRGPALESLRALVRETGARAVFWNRRYEPAVVARDTRVREGLQADGIEAESFNAALLFEPWTVRNKAGRPFQVFTPFWKSCLGRAKEIGAPAGSPSTLRGPEKWPQSLDLAGLELEPKVDWAAGLRGAWEPGEDGAAAQLQEFAADGLAGYPANRDRPDLDGVSRLSPHLHFGEISPRQIWGAMRRRRGAAAAAFLRQLGWREFAHHLLFHFPRTPSEPLREEFEAFPWRSDATALRAWQRGRTGYPIVDAGMRQLWATGWMHNRVRMIVASFLTKDLLIPWQEGARWFWDTLVDADLANNTLGWQWTAGCGADAAPYFRVFNPVSQGERFDPQGDYVRRWVPELVRLPARWIHRPWEAPAGVARDAGLELGNTYPARLVKHEVARLRALAAYADRRPKR